MSSGLIDMCNVTSRCVERGQAGKTRRGRRARACFTDTERRSAKQRVLAQLSQLARGG